MIRCFFHMKMQKKLLLAPLVAIAFLSILGVVSYLGLQEQQSTIRDIFENRFRMYRDSARIMSNIKGVHANIYQVLNLASIEADQKLVDELGKQQLAALDATLNLMKGVMGRNLSAEESKCYESSFQQLTEYRDAAFKTIDMASNDYNLATAMMKPAVQKFQILSRNLEELMTLENDLCSQRNDSSIQSFSRTLTMFIAVFVAAIVLSLLTSISMTRLLLRMIRKTGRAVEVIAGGDLSQPLEIEAKDEIGQLAESVDAMRARMEQAVGKSMSIAGSLAESSTEQAASLEETTASLTEAASNTKQNAKNTLEADQLMEAGKRATERANASMADLAKSMKDITDAGVQAQKIVKSIDEVAFQTNLLALNAAVEAARAGEAGAGFAVVADEVRNLAMRATDAAKGTTTLIEDIIKKVQLGQSLVESTGGSFREAHDTSNRIADLVKSIAAASKEQSEGIGEIEKAIREMNVVTQRNAALSDELSSTMAIFKIGDAHSG